METTTLIGCPLCEASCGLRLTVRDGEVAGIRGHRGDPLSRGHICPKGVALQDLHTDPERLRRPVRRVGETWLEIGWDEAIHRAAEGLVGVQRRHGRDALAVYLGNPNVHSLGALTHGLALPRTLRSRNTYSATSVDQLPHQMVAWMLYGHQFLLPVPDIDRTELLVLVGHNPMVSNGSLWTVPDFPARVRELHARGGRIVVLDPRRTQTARVADEHHHIRPGTDAAVLLALVNVVLSERLSRAAEYVDGIAQVAVAVREFTPEAAERVSGVPAAMVRDLARDIAGSRAAVHGRLGASTQQFGLVCQWAIAVLHALTGNLDREGGVMFTHPAVDLVGRGLLGRGHFGAWHSRVRGLPEFAGELPVSTLADEMLTPGEGQVRGLLTIAGNPVVSTPGGARLERAIRDLDFHVAIDPWIGPTSRHADLILPPTGPLERDHYDLLFHMLAVRNTARFSPAVFPRAKDARHDWEIARDLVFAIHRYRGTRTPLSMRAQLRMTPRQTLDLLLRSRGIHDRWAALDPTLGLRGGLSVKRLMAHPEGLDAGPLRPRLPGRLFTANHRIDLAQPLVLDDLPRVRESLLGTRADGSSAGSPQAGQQDRGHLLLIGRRHQRDNNSWMGSVERLSRGQARHLLLIHPGDAAVRGLRDGDTAQVRSGTGEVIVRCRLSDEVMSGVVCLPHGYGYGRPGVSMNDLTDPAVIDDSSGNAVLTGVPVQVELSLTAP